MCDFWRIKCNVKCLIPLQNVTLGQPFQIILVYSSPPADIRLISEVFTTAPQSSENSWFRNLVEKSGISLPTHIYFQLDVTIHRLIQNVVFDKSVFKHQFSQIVK